MESIERLIARVEMKTYVRLVRRTLKEMIITGEITQISGLELRDQLAALPHGNIPDNVSRILRARNICQIFEELNSETRPF